MGAIQLRTAIPGPASKELWRRRREAVPAGIYHAAPVFIARSEGALVEDVDGNRMIDFAGGISCLNAGHRAPRVLAAVHAVLEIVDEEKLPACADELGERFRSRAFYWQSRWPEIGDVRGVGAMQAIEFVRDPGSQEPAKALAEEVARLCHERGLLVLTAGTYGNVIRLLVPLNILRPQFEEGLEVLEAAIVTAFEQQPQSAPGV
ncbi:MAG TPA: aminotransferase class III-fold pyridoxal phosphate-dependent enzyme [Candidatus Acidoferrales bacterium]|nr:aminotransferase class III-fold pyridoxal phosphate-dependent enzyme [Candidatus Acidoferrales bacterium]